MKLCLGTVQFGLNYGFRGRTMPPREQAIAMLDCAVRNGIDAIDTSTLYGDAESVVGEFFSRCPVERENLFLVSKFGVSGLEGLSSKEVERRLLDVAEVSLSRLGVKKLDAYICHVPSAVYDDRILQAMQALRRVGLADHVGFSVYETAEADIAIKSGVVDFLQVPLSVLDQRMANQGVLDRAAQSGVLLHSRSAYVQGLALMDVAAVPDCLSEVRPIIDRLDALCKSLGVSRQVLALAFVRSFGQISHLVFGVHDMAQLVANIKDFSAEVPEEAIREAKRLFSDVKPELVMPNKWKR